MYRLYRKHRPTPSIVIIKTHSRGQRNETMFLLPCRFGLLLDDLLDDLSFFDEECADDAAKGKI